MSEYRRSALVIHGLSSRDRQWMLARLSDEQRAILLPLLAELKTLGIPKTGIDPWIVGKEPAAESGPLDNAELELVNNADPEEMRLLLQPEAAQVVAAILSIHDWDWRAGLMKQYSTERQNEVVRALELGRRNGLSPRLRQSMLASLAWLLRDTREQRLHESESGYQYVFPRSSGLFGQIWRSLWPA